jgi:hypothetical protein
MFRFPVSKNRYLIYLRSDLPIENTTLAIKSRKVQKKKKKINPPNATRRMALGFAQ